VSFPWLASSLDTDTVYVMADDDGTGASTENECDETNNLHWQPCVVGVDLAISKDDDQTTVLPGERVTYTLSVSNVGILPATGVVISDTLPTQGIAFVSASDGGTLDAGTVTWPSFDLAAGATVTRTVTIQVNNPLSAGVDSITNTATVADDGTNGPDLTPEDNTTSDIDTVDATPDLHIEKDDNGFSTTPGGVITYTLTYTNLGHQYARGVIITETRSPWPACAWGETRTKETIRKHALL
jgi:uncharacterized repeat protein (TIGR01451 family)